MKTLILLATLVAGPAGAAERILTLTDFDRVQVDGNFVVEVTTGRGTSGRISGDAAAIDTADVQVQGRTLIIRKNRANWSGSGNSQTTTTVRITVPALHNAWVRGPAIVRLDRMSGMRVGLSQEGSGSLSVADMRSDRLDLGMLGSGRIAVAGTVATLNATVRGSGELDAARLIASDAKVVSETAGNVSLSVRRAANVTSTGAGNVTILGKPACTVKNAGSGNVSCGSDQSQ